MRRFFNFSFGFFIFLLSLFFLLTSCENPLFVEATKLYEVTFETNGGSRIESYHTERIEKTPETEKAGFTFDGWYRNSSLTTKIESFPLKIESNMTLYAKWKQNYRVTFVTNGGSAINETNSMDVCILDSAPLTNRDGFEVTAWYLNAGFSGSPVSFPYQVTSPITLYAKWAPVFTINFVTNGGSIISPKKTTSLKVAPLSERAGFTLVGWYADEELTESVSFPLELSQSMTLYARWERNFTVNFESNGGTAFENLSTWCVEQRPEPIKSGLSFGGWYTSSDFAPSTKVTFPFYPNKNTTLYARWNYYNYIVTYELNGGYNHSENPDGFDKENNAIPLHEPTLTGCEFLGWFDNANFSGSAITEIPANANEDKTYHAKWKLILYSIEYVLNGGTNDTKNSVSYTVETETFRLNSPSKTGYSFGGWYEKADFSGQSRKEIEKGSVGNKKLYAKWIPTEYAITYNLNGGRNNEANLASYTIESASFILQDASRNGYSFAGWYENANYTGARITQIAKGSYGMKSLYAKWNVITYSIEYVLNGGTLSTENPTLYTVEDLPLEIQTPCKDGYFFDGWYETADFSGKCISEIAGEILGSKILYAKWTADVRLSTFDFLCDALVVYADSKKESKIRITPDVHEYYIEFQKTGAAANTEAVLQIVANPSDKNATVSLSNGDKNLQIKALDSKNQDVTLCITAADKVTTNTYLLHVERVFSYEDACTALTGRNQNMFVKIMGEVENDKYYVESMILKLNKVITSTSVYFVSLDISNIDLTSLGAEAFKNCEGLEEVILPSKLTRIGNCAFFGCISLKKIELTDMINVIGDGAFTNCSSLESLNIPKCISMLNNRTFYGCSKLKKLIVPETVTRLGANVFYGMTEGSVVFADHYSTWYWSPVINYSISHPIGPNPSISVLNSYNYYANSKYLGL